MYIVRGIDKCNSFCTTFNKCTLCGVKLQKYHKKCRRLTPIVQPTLFSLVFFLINILRYLKKKEKSVSFYE